MSGAQESVSQRRAHRLPEDKQAELGRAKRQEWTTIVLRLTVIGVLYGAVDVSHSLSAIWLKSLWSLWPPIAFLVALALEKRPPTPRFPFGFYRSVSIGFLTSALSLVAMGLYLVIAGGLSYVHGAPDKLPSLAGMGVWWRWPGWWVLAALAYSMAVPLVIGRRRKRHAVNLHDKGLFADVSMGHVSALAAGMAMIGVLGIGLGAGWLDSLATCLIGLVVLGQGLRHLATAVCDLVDEMPRKLGTRTLDPIADRIHARLCDADWVEDVRVRLREEGRMLTGIALVCPDERRARVQDFEALRDAVQALDWRLLEFQLVPVARADFDALCHD